MKIFKIRFFNKLLTLYKTDLVSRDHSFSNIKSRLPCVDQRRVRRDQGYIVVELSFIGYRQLDFATTDHRKTYQVRTRDNRIDFRVKNTCKQLQKGGYMIGSVPLLHTG